ncbi:MAG: beta-galactosidase [Acidobacteriaceae bacterium]
MNRRRFNQLAGMTGLTAMLAPAALAMEPVEQNGASSASVRGGERWSRYLVGTAYYPEWWQPAEWETDFSAMQAMGINAVRMGEFAWGIYEPTPGKFEFAWMDEAIAIAGRHGIGVVLGTPTASIPPWLYQLHPDVLTGNTLGPYTYGGRKGYCPNSANYEDACARIVTALAEHYGHNPGVIGWQLDNEPGYPFEMFDPNSESAFRVWLEDRYGTIENLNRAWNGAFWSNHYNDWSQIHFPTNSAEGGWQPAISLAYREFYSDSFLRHLRRQTEILRPKTGNQFIFTNWPAPTWSVNVYTAAREFLDATGWDNYVSAPGLSGFHRQYTSAFLSDFSRCAGPHQRFLCSEQNAYVPPNADTEGLRLQAYMDVAHGALGHFYFEWRRPLAGNEQYRPSFIKGFNGEMNPDKDTLEQICRELARIGPRLAPATTRSDIAILFDFTNQWAEGFGAVGDKGTRYDDEVPRYYSGFKVLGRNIDVVPLDSDFAAYRLILAPNLRLIDDRTVDRLRVFVANGGTLVLNDRAATQNMDCSMRRTLAPGPFSAMAGVHSVAMLQLTEYNAQNGTFEGQDKVEIVFTDGKAAFHPRTIVESLVLDGAEALATVRGGGKMSGQPAITRNRHGRGWVFYVGTDSADEAFYESLAQQVGSACGSRPLIEVPYGVEVTSRQDGNTVYYFLLNLTGDAQAPIPLAHAMEDCITGKTGVTQVSLGPFGVAVLAGQSSNA